jgi:hypothetical protein
MMRDGSFDAIESARPFIRESLEKKKGAVQRVAEGSEPDAWLTSRFGYPTRKDGYRAFSKLIPDTADQHGRGVLPQRVKLIRDL